MTALASLDGFMPDLLLLLTGNGTERTPEDIRTLANSPVALALVLYSRGADDTSEGSAAALTIGADGRLAADTPPVALERSLRGVLRGEIGAARCHVAHLVSALRGPSLRQLTLDDATVVVLTPHPTAECGGSSSRGANGGGSNRPPWSSSRRTDMRLRPTSGEAPVTSPQ